MQTTTDDLARLLGQVARADRQAFAALYNATSAKLYAVILRILRRRDLAEEVLQDVYVRVWQRAGDFDPTRASPITWMAAIARNRALDVVRRATPLSIEDVPAALEVADTGRLASEQVEISDELRRLEACLDRLEPGRKEIVKLAYLEGLSREELARRFGHPVATIKTWLHRSLKQIRDCLGS
jgi:RNA polymerase sigma-70 factor (ECF subfamily)